MSFVLVVDDDEDIRMLVAELLRVSGHDVIGAPSGVAALALLERGTRPDLVLLDVQMPDLDGWDTLRRIRSLDGVSEVPVVLCTVKSGPVDTALGQALGCDGYVVKPFAIVDLVEEVAAVLSRSPEERRARRTLPLRA